jgi:hypothetical protein
VRKATVGDEGIRRRVGCIGLTSLDITSSNVTEASNNSRAPPPPY